MELDINFQLTSMQVQMLNTILPKGYKLIQRIIKRKRASKMLQTKWPSDFKKLQITINPLSEINIKINQLQSFSKYFINLFTQMKTILQGYNSNDWSKTLINYSRGLKKKNPFNDCKQVIQAAKQQIQQTLRILNPFQKILKMQKEFIFWKQNGILNLKKSQTNIQSRSKSIGDLKAQMLQKKQQFLLTFKQELLQNYEMIDFINQKLWVTLQLFNQKIQQEEEKINQYQKLISTQLLKTYDQKLMYKYEQQILLKPHVKKLERIKQLNHIVLELKIYAEQIEKFFINLQKLICQKYYELETHQIQIGIRNQPQYQKIEEEFKFDLTKNFVSQQSKSSSSQVNYQLINSNQDENEASDRIDEQDAEFEEEIQNKEIQEEELEEGEIILQNL